MFNKHIIFHFVVDIFVYTTIVFILFSLLALIFGAEFDKDMVFNTLFFGSTLGFVMALIETFCD